MTTRQDVHENKKCETRVKIILYHNLAQAIQRSAARLTWPAMREAPYVNSGTVG